MGRNYLTGRDGDRINAVLAAAGYNFSLLSPILLDLSLDRHAARDTTKIVTCEL
jgi:hypothetical protein